MVRKSKIAFFGAVERKVATMPSLTIKNVPKELHWRLKVEAFRAELKFGEYCVGLLRAGVPKGERVPNSVLSSGFEALAPRPALEAEAVKEIISRGAGKRSAGRGRGEAGNLAKELPRPAGETEEKDEAEFGFEQKASHAEEASQEKPKMGKPKKAGKLLCPRCDTPLVDFTATMMHCPNPQCGRNTLKSELGA